MDEWPDIRKASFLALAEPIPGPTIDRLSIFARKTGRFICVGLLEQDGDHRYNTQVIISPSEGILGRYRKVHVAHCEEWFSSSGHEFPVFDVAGFNTHQV